MQPTTRPLVQESPLQQVFVQPSTFFQPTNQSYYGQVGASTGQETSYILNQIDEALAEADAHVYAGEARLQENNILEAIREFELARQLVENDVNPGLQYIQQLPKVQGGATILSESQIQSIRIQQQSILERINRSYDFQALYERQRNMDRINTLREQNKPVLKPLVLDRRNIIQNGIVKPEIPTSEEYVGHVVIDDLFLVIPVQDVEWYIEKFQQHQATFHSYLLRTNQYYPVVSSILSSHGVPKALAYVGLVASGSQPTVKDSASGKVGLWQLSADVARHYGLRVSSTQDERKDVEASTAAFARYMRDLQHRFGSWDLAIMAYEMGEQKFQRVVNRAGSYEAEEIRHYLGASSPEGSFLPKLAAAILIAENPVDFGFTAGQLSQFSGSGTTQTLVPVNVELNETPVTTILNQ